MVQCGQLDIIRLEVRLRLSMIMLLLQKHAYFKSFRCNCETLKLCSLCQILWTRSRLGLQGPRQVIGLQQDCGRASFKEYFMVCWAVGLCFIYMQSMLSTLKNSFIKIHEWAQTFLHVHAHANTLIPAPRRTHTRARTYTHARAHTGFAFFYYSLVYFSNLHCEFNSEIYVVTRFYK